MIRIRLLAFIGGLALTGCSTDTPPEVSGEITGPAEIRQAAIAIPDPYAADIAEDEVGFRIRPAKFGDHLPLYRLEQIFARSHQVEIPRQSMGNWMELVADWL